LGNRTGKTPNSPLWRRGPFDRPDPEEPMVTKQAPSPTYPRNRPSHTPLPDDTDDEQDAGAPEMLPAQAEPTPANISTPSKALGPVVSESLALERAQSLASQSIDLCLAELTHMATAWRKDIALTGASVKSINMLIELATGATKAQSKKQGSSGSGKGKELQDFLSRATKANPKPEGDD